MAQEKESFVFYRSFFEALQDLKDKERLQVYDAICDLALNENDTKLKGIAKTVFTLIRPQILSNTKKYKNGQKGAEYGKLGGRPKKVKTPEGLLKETPNVNENENENENVNVNDNANVNVNASDSCVDGLQKIIDFYNANIGLITPYGADTLESYLGEMDFEVIIFAMKKAVEANVRTIQYIKGTLNNWKSKGVKTLLQAQEESEQFRQEKAHKCKEVDNDNLKEWLKSREAKQ